MHSLPGGRLPTFIWNISSFSAPATDSQRHVVGYMHSLHDTQEDTKLHYTTLKGHYTTEGELTLFKEVGATAFGDGIAVGVARLGVGQHAAYHPLAIELDFEPTHGRARVQRERVADLERHLFVVPVALNEGHLARYVRDGGRRLHAHQRDVGVRLLFFTVLEGLRPPSASCYVAAATPEAKRGPDKSGAFCNLHCSLLGAVVLCCCGMCWWLLFALDLSVRPLFHVW